nr:hypothetical protein [Tanacetum cinerariifolium]
MRTRNSYFPNNSSATIPRRRNKRRTPNVVEHELRTIVEMADNRTMEELLKAPTKWYGEAAVISEINVDHFEIKTNLLQLVQANPYHGFERENPHTHINNFKRITSSLKFRDVPNDDLVNKFVNQFFPPSNTTHLKNEISRFTQRFEETFGEAWERFKEMLRACPHHEFTELAQIDTFYNGLNDNDQDSLNAAAGGNLLRKTTREALQIIENKLKVCYSRNKPNVFRMNTTSRDNASKSDDRIDKLAGIMLVSQMNTTSRDIFAKNIVTPASVKAVEESCVTCSGTLPSNTIPNSKGEMKAITTRSGVAYEGPSIPTLKKVVEQETEETTDKKQSNFQGKLADRSITRPKGVVEDFFVKVRKFHFSTDFVVVDFEADPRVPLILEEYAQEILGFSSNSSGGSLTSTFEPILFYSSHSLTSFKGSDFILEEIDAYLKDESISPEIDHADCDPEGDICLIENLLNDDPFQLSPMDLKEVIKIKSSIEEPPEVELKELLSHLEYAYLEENDKLPVIISKDLKDDEKEALLNGLKSHKRAIA